MRRFLFVPFGTPFTNVIPDRASHCEFTTRDIEPFEPWYFDTFTLQ
jgi:hypothetical protein